MNGQPLVFISYYHKDLPLAQEFSALLSDASLNALPSFYAKGTPYGREWYQTIMEKLREATAVVALLTPRSIDRPWLSFEAGVAKGKLKQTDVFGVTFGVGLDKAYNGPFAIFQNCTGDENSLTIMIRQLIEDHHLEVAPTQGTIHDAVKAFLARLQADDGDEPGTEEPDLTAKLFEEVKLIGSDLRKHDFAKIIGPRLFQDFPLVLEGGGYDATGLLLLLGAIREDLPWLYEIGLRLYHALITGNQPEIVRAKDQVVRSVKIAKSNEWLRSILDRRIAAQLFNLPDIIEDYLRPLDPASPSKTHKGRRKRT